jgi:hypothetical protein
MFFVTADVVSQEWNEFFGLASKVLALESIGTFSPTLTSEFYHIGRMPNIFFDSGLPLSVIQCNDLIVTFINRHAILEMVAYFDFFNSAEDTFDPVVGFGLTQLLTSIVNSKKLVHVRDRSFTLRHPEGTSYDSRIANEQRVMIDKISERFCKQKHYLWWKKGSGNSIDLGAEVHLKSIKMFR